MGYIVKVTFADLEDGKRLYHEGDKFPREGLAVSSKRLEQLAGSDNLTGKPLIAKVDEPDHMQAAEPQEAKQTRKRGRKNAD